MATKWMLIDTNTYFFNCGHYPHWEAVPATQGTSEKMYATKEEAATAAAKKNAASKEAWQDFLSA